MTTFTQQLISTIASVVQKTHDSIEAEWIRHYQTNGGTAANHFVVFLKPEVLAADKGVSIDAILRVVFDAFQHWKVDVGAIRLLTAQYLKRHELMDRHYGVINEISKRGNEAISPAAQVALQGAFEKEITEGAEILGGHQFLTRFPAFSPFSLSVLADNMGAKKLAGGTYCVSLRVEGKPFLLLNGFHPFQLEYYTRSGQAILVFECRSESPWTSLRQELVGSTNPVAAATNSVRRTFLDRRVVLGLAEVSQSVNGVHLSAGPLEGMVELQRFLSEPERMYYLAFRDMSFGQLLASEGATDEQISCLAKNPVVLDGNRLAPAFDITEEMDASSAATKLTKLVSDNATKT